MERMERRERELEQLSLIILDRMIGHGLQSWHTKWFVETQSVVPPMYQEEVIRRVMRKFHK